jgi:predicted amidohydrolase
VNGVERIGQHVWAIISKGNWQFQELDHDGMLGSRGRMSLELSPEKDHRDLALRLYLAWAPHGSIRWVEARVIDVTEQRAEKRRVKLAAVSGRPRKGCSSAEALEFYCQRLDAVGAQRVDLVCLPEFINKDRIEADLTDVAEPIPGGTWVSRFAQKAREHGMYIAAGLIERDGRQIYNAGVLIGRDGTLVGKYRKTHPTVAESLLQGTASGDSYSVFDTDIGKIGYMICFDNHQPEVARILAVKGAEIIVFPNGSDGREAGSLYEPYMRTRALDNQVHIVAAVNLPGQTCIVTPRGEFAARADNAPGAIAIATCDLSTRVRDGSGRQIEARYMRVRRADTFAPILREYWERNAANDAK